MHTLRLTLSLSKGIQIARTGGAAISDDGDGVNPVLNSAADNAP